MVSRVGRTCRRHIPATVFRCCEPPATTTTTTRRAAAASTGRLAGDTPPLLHSSHCRQLTTASWFLPSTNLVGSSTSLAVTIDANAADKWRVTGSGRPSEPTPTTSAVQTEAIDCGSSQRRTERDFRRGFCFGGLHQTQVHFVCLFVCFVNKILFI